MFIYKASNKINGKIYIGQTTVSIKKRWIDHCKPSRGKVSAISNAIQKHGRENFTIEEIDGANSLSELNYLEKYYICKFNSLSPSGYNLQIGGNNTVLSKEYIINRSKPIVDITTGNIYKNIYEAAKKFNKKPDNILDNVRNKTAICANRSFKYLQDWNGIIVDVLKKHKELLLETRRRQLSYSIVDTSSGIVYRSIPEAAGELRIPVSSVKYNVNGYSKRCRGRVFKKTEHWDGKIIPVVLKKENPGRRKKVIETNTKQIYNSINEAAESLNVKSQSITDNLSGRTKLIGKKYKFEYLRVNNE